MTDLEKQFIGLLKTIESERRLDRVLSALHIDKRPVSAEEINAMAETFKVPLDFLIGLKDMYVLTHKELRDIIIGKPMEQTAKNEESETMKQENKGHIHAEDMALYAEDAKTHERPWELWQVNRLNIGWVNLSRTPVWQEKASYRRKPQPKEVVQWEIKAYRMSSKSVECFTYAAEGCANNALQRMYNDGYIIVEPVTKRVYTVEV